MKLFSKLLVIGLFGINLTALAEEAKISNWWAAGTKDCNKKNVQLLQNGDAFSFVFNQFGPQLEENEKTRAETSVCILTILFELPKDRCIDRLDQVMTGGLLKSRASRGDLYFTTFLNGLNRHHYHAAYRLGKEITPVDPESFIEHTSSQNTQCIRSRYQVYVGQIVFGAVKSSNKDFFIGNIDSIDGEVSIKVRTRR